MVLERKKQVRNPFISADFETTQDGKFSCWGYFYEGKFYYDVTLQSFIDSIKTHQRKIIAYCHNLSKFDGEFIVKGLHKICVHNHSKHNDKHNVCKYYIQKQPGKETNVLHYTRKTSIRNYEEKDNSLLQPYEWSFFKDENKIYNIRVGTWRKKISKKIKPVDEYQTIEFRDSLLLFSTYSIDSMGKQIGFKKLKVKKDFYKNIKVYKTKEDIPEKLIKYLKRDCLILYKFINKMSETIPRTQWKKTIGSTSYNYYCSTNYKVLADINGKHIREVPFTVTRKDGKKKEYIKYYIGKKRYYSKALLGKHMLNEILKTQWMDEINTEYNAYTSCVLKNWYKGGLTHCNRYYQGKQLNNITIYDVNSMYPYHMISNYFPIGEPFKGDGGKEYPLKLYKIAWTSFETKSFPLIKNTLGQMNFYKLKWDKKLIENTIVTGEDFVTNFELDYIEKNYDFKNTLIKQVEYSFKQIHGSKLFGPYIKTLYKNKSSSKGPKKAFWKLLLNSFYGKFGTKSERKSKLWNEKTRSYEIEEKTTKSSFYIPIAIFITAYSRLYLANAVGKNYKHFYYCDTDSIHVNDEYKDLFNITIGDKLGQWKEESTTVLGLYRRAKQYMLSDKIIIPKTDYKLYINYQGEGKEEDEANIVIKLAGSTRGKFPDNMNFEMFANGYDVKNLQRKPSEEGVILREMIKRIPSWQSDTYQDWRLPKDDEVNYVLNPKTNKLEILK